MTWKHRCEGLRHSSSSCVYTAICRPSQSPEQQHTDTHQATLLTHRHIPSNTTLPHTLHSPGAIHSSDNFQKSHPTFSLTYPSTLAPREGRTQLGPIVISHNNWCLTSSCLPPVPLFQHVQNSRPPQDIQHFHLAEASLQVIFTFKHPEGSGTHTDSGCATIPNPSAASARHHLRD
jgi:hypothetical protein